ncbi:expressed unknown protein [Seminavis robusta]|uniref:MYND-type domain-containing protein n=1 Tax=Seminavis robusta TaxID=568900 RepID=A0A9N8HLM3_9STRA|nr:expressed unknown protein [Seminavis robusta]|eukprot:Sro927_g221190.1 n/a (380) ;mRNA; f:36238-37377
MEKTQMKRLLDVIKIQRFCLFCGKPEPKETSFPSQCSRCKEEGFIPPVFCSDKCANKAWKQHKKWHNEDAAETKEKLSRHLEFALYFRYTEKSVAGLSESANLALSGDINGAKKLLRNYLKQEGEATPTEYLQLGFLFDASGQVLEEQLCMEKACKQLAYTVLVAGRCVADDEYRNYVIHRRARIDTDIQVGVFESAAKWCFYVWANCMIRRMEIIGQAKNYALPKPNWWKHPASGIRITKVACNQLLQVGPACHKQVWKDKLELCNAMDNPDCPSLGKTGLWVVIHGLVEESQIALNGRFGVVCTDTLIDGHVGVDVKDDGPWVLPDNLWQVPFSEKDLALISTLDADDQWKYVKGSRELSMAYAFVVAGKTRQSTGV